MKPLIAIILALIAGPALAQQTVIRDSAGRTVGTVSRDSAGTETFRDSAGRTTGTATRDSGGTTTFRDNMGRVTGTATRSGSDER
jgi:hypothetical protein